MNDTNVKTYFHVLQSEYLKVKNIDMIHPLKQRLVYDIVTDRLSDYLDCIDKVVVFGSSTSMRCCVNSDLDIAVRFADNMDTLENKNAVSELIGKETDWNYDVVWLNGINENGRLYNEILSEGRVVYE